MYCVEPESCVAFKREGESGKKRRGLATKEAGLFDLNSADTIPFTGRASERVAHHTGGRAELNSPIREKSGRSDLLSHLLGADDRAKRGEVVSQHWSPTTSL